MQDVEAWAGIRAEIIDTNSVLVSEVARFVARGASYFPPWGNMGDGLIGLGEHDFFSTIGLQPRKVLGRGGSAFLGERLVIYGGGGGLLEGFYGDVTSNLTPLLDAGGEVLILPSSVRGYEEFFIRFKDQITIFAREQFTYNFLKKLGVKCYLAHDMAFATDLSRFSHLPSSLELARRLNIFRTDREGAGTVVAQPNLDLPLALNVMQWHDPIICTRALNIAANWMRLFSEIHTDRLHMAILGALNGINVTMYPNIYYKNIGVFQHSLYRFPKLVWGDDNGFVATAD